MASAITPRYEELNQSLRGTVLLPHDPDYETVRKVWNRYPNRKPSLIVRARGTQDVVHAVQFASAHHLPISVRSGGHHVAGLGAGDDGLMLDLSLMRSVVVNPVARTATVEGGATAADVIRETQLFGLAVPTGNIGRVGIAALALGGGMGFLRRRHGLTCDFLEAADMVLADGTVLHVDAEHHPDLFWAIRGGGGNFGIATALYFRLVEVGPTVAGIHVVYSFADAKAVLTGCRDFLATCGPNVSINVDIMSMLPLPEIPPVLSGKTVIIVSGMHAGHDLDKALSAIRPLSTLAEPLADMTGPTSYTALHSVLDNMLPKEHFGHVESFYADTFTDELIDEVTGIMAKARPGQMLMLWPLGGKMAEPAPAATAFGDRGAGLVVMLESGWQNPAEAPDGRAWVQGTRSSLMRHAYNGGTYLNVTDPTTPDAEHVIRAAYGSNYPRLLQVKTVYDPQNRFRFNANITPATLNTGSVPLGEGY